MREPRFKYEDKVWIKTEVRHGVVVGGPFVDGELISYKVMYLCDWNFPIWRVKVLTGEYAWLPYYDEDGLDVYKPEEAAVDLEPR